MPSLLKPLIGAVFLWSSGAATQTPSPALPQSAVIDDYVTSALDAVELTPGMAVAVYTPEGVYTRGFGVTDIESGEATDADTAFYIASSTKTATALLMAILDEEGALDLDQSLASFAPDAPFPDQVRADEVTIRHMLSHSSGIINNPVSFRAAYTGEHTRALNWHLLAASEVNEDSPLGTYQYTNTGYNILTILTDRELGAPWQDLLHDRIFAPAGMTHTSAYMSYAEKGGWSVARPHFSGLKSGTVRIGLEKTDSTMQSAGGLIMSAADAARWLELLIEDGRIGGEQIVPSSAVQALRAPAVETGGADRTYPSHHYGLGLEIAEYRGEELLYQFGGFAGARTHISFMPDRRVGVAVMINDTPVGHPLADLIANKIYDTVLDLPTTEEDSLTLEAIVSRRDGLLDRIAADIKNRSMREWQLSQPFSAYTGTYVNELYGTVLITEEEGALRFRMGNLDTLAEPFTKKDTARIELVPYRGQVAVFDVSEDGTVLAMTTDGDRFERQAD